MEILAGALLGLGLALIALGTGLMVQALIDKVNR